jgi:hypothetical protein
VLVEHDWVGEKFLRIRDLYPISVAPKNKGLISPFC